VIFVWCEALAQQERLLVGVAESCDIGEANGSSRAGISRKLKIDPTTKRKSRHRFRANRETSSVHARVGSGRPELHTEETMGPSSLERCSAVQDQFQDVGEIPH